MCSVLAGLTALSTVMQVRSQKQQADAQANMYRAQADAAEQNARIENRKQEQIADNYAQQSRQLRSRQRLAEGSQRAETGAAGLGQVIKVAQKEQDEADYMSAMKAKNDIRAKIMDGVYGEGGLFETGVGENAAGLTDRVTELVQKTYQEEGSKYNGRVQRLLLGDYNENTMNLQRISSSKEMSEREKLVDENYGIALDQAGQNAAMNAGDAQTLSLSMGDVERNVYAYGAKKGWSGQQVQAELRKANTSLISGVVSSLIADDRMDDAFSILVGNRARMDQKEYTRLYGMLKKDKDTKDDLTFVKGFYRADGTYDWDGARKAAVDKWGPNARRYVAGGYGGSFTGDSGLDIEIASAAQSENVEAALLAAVASEESGYDQSSVSPRP